MGHPNKTGFADKHPGESVDPSLKDAIESAARNGVLDCAAAHRAARACHCKPADIGRQADLLGLRISRCQLGLFGYGPGKKNLNPDISLPDRLRAQILGVQTHGRLSCRRCWELAADQGLSRADMGSACEKLEIRIKPCQLGAF